MYNYIQDLEPNYNCITVKAKCVNLITCTVDFTLCVLPYIYFNTPDMCCTTPHTIVVDVCKVRNIDQSQILSNGDQNYSLLNSLGPIKSSLKKQKPCTIVFRL